MSQSPFAVGSNPPGVVGKDLSGVRDWWDLDRNWQEDGQYLGCCRIMGREGRRIKAPGTGGWRRSVAYGRCSGIFGPGA